MDIVVKYIKRAVGIFLVSPFPRLFEHLRVSSIRRLSSKLGSVLVVGHGSVYRLTTKRQRRPRTIVLTIVRNPTVKERNG